MNKQKIIIIIILLSLCSCYLSMEKLAVKYPDKKTNQNQNKKE
jgi:hypothetical protein